MDQSGSLLGLIQTIIKTERSEKPVVMRHFGVLEFSPIPKKGRAPTLIW